MLLKSTDLSELKVCFAFLCITETFSDGKEEKYNLPQGLMESSCGI